MSFYNLTKLTVIPKLYKKIGIMCFMEINVTDASFEREVMKKSKTVPVLVDFWADWCGPCIMLKPIIEKIAKDYDGKFILAKAATEDNQNIASKLGVMSIPSVKLFKGGKVVAEFLGLQPEAVIRQWLDEKL